MLEQALSVAAAKAKLTGLVIAAAAVGGTAVAAGSTAFVPTAGEDTVVTAPTETPSPEAPVVDPTPEATVAADATPEETRTPLPCPTDVKNHGSYVKLVAKDKTLKGREHGQAVSEAAKSDCGKPAADATESADAEDSDAPEVEATEAPDSDDADDAATNDTPKEKHGKGRGHQ